MPDDSPKDYASRQSKHATRIASERALMDVLGLSRSQARQLNEGLTEFSQRIDQRPAEVLGPPAPPQFQVSEVKTEKAPPIIGREKNVGGSTANNPPGGTLTTIQAIVVDGGFFTAEEINVLTQ